MRTMKLGRVVFVSWTLLAVLRGGTDCATAQIPACVHGSSQAEDEQRLAAEVERQSLALAAERRALTEETRAQRTACRSEPTCVAAVKVNYANKNAVIDQKYAALNAWHDQQRRHIAACWDCLRLTAQRDQFRTEVAIERARIEVRLHPLLTEKAAQEDVLRREVALYNSGDYGPKILQDEHGNVRGTIPNARHERRFGPSLASLTAIQRRIVALDTQITAIRRRLDGLEQVVRSYDAERATRGCP